MLTPFVAGGVYGTPPEPTPTSVRQVTRWKAFLALVAVGLVAHRQFVRKRDLYPGIMHFAIFWGFSILLFATTLAALEFNAEKYLNWVWPTVHARIPLGFTWDIFGGGLAAIGLSMAA